MRLSDLTSATCLSWAFLVGLALLSGVAKAQLNESDSAVFQTRATITGLYQRGNVQFLSLRGNLTLLGRLSDQLVAKSQNSVLYQEFFTVRADTDLDSRNFLYYRPQERIYPFAMAFLYSSFRRELDFRYFTGLGVTGQLIRSKQHTLKLSGSLVYEQAEFSDNSFNDPEYNGSPLIRQWRATLYLGGWHYWAERGIRIYYEAHGQPSLSDRNNYRIHADVGADIKMWKNLSFTASYSLTHESIVVQGVKQTDELLTFGLAYLFRKDQSD